MVSQIDGRLSEVNMKDDTGNAEVVMRKFLAFVREHKYMDYEIKEGPYEGMTPREVAGGDYLELHKSLLNGENLTSDGMKMLDNIQHAMEANGHSNLAPEVGKAGLDSFNPGDTGIRTEATVIKTPNMVNDTPEVAGGMFGFGWIKKLKEKFRPGAKADRVEAKAGPQVDPVDPVIPVVDPVEKMLLDEYKIVYGIAPITEEGKNQQWLNYCARVEEERKVAAPDKDMNQFLLDRRAKLDEVIESNISHMKNGDTKDLPRIKKDYEIRKAKDTRSHAMIIGEVRQSLMQSNLTRDNYINAITLSHFTEYADMTIAGGDAYKHSRNIHLNPKLDRHYQKEGSRVSTFDMNAALLGGKHIEGERGAGKDFREHSRKLQERYER